MSRLFTQLVLIFSLFFLTRLTNLTLLPIHIDEANYLNWGWFTVHGSPFYPLFDAKTPALMWLFGTSQMLFPDPLQAGRLISIFTGLVNLTLLAWLASRLISRRAILIVSLLYIFSPYFLFYDRQALMESALTSTYLFSFILLWQLTIRPSLKKSACLGAILSIGFWIKPTALVLLAAAAPVLIPHGLAPRRPIFYYFGPLCITLLSFAILSSPILLHPSFRLTWPRNSEYTLPSSQILTIPINYWKNNLVVAAELWPLLLTPTVFLPSIFGLIGLFYKRSSLILILWIFVPISIIIVIARPLGDFIHRYTVPFLPLLLLTATLWFNHHNRFLIPALILPISLSLLLIQNPIRYFQLTSQFSRYSYIRGYVTGPNTGYQTAAIISYLKTQALSEPIIVGLSPYHNPHESAVNVYLREAPNILPRYFPLNFPPSLSSHDCLSTPLPFYSFAKPHNTHPLAKFLLPIALISNSYNSEKTTIYTLKTGCSPDQTISLPLTVIPIPTPILEP